MASNALHIALERHSKLKAIYDSELFRIELLEIKGQALPIENPECTVAHEEAFKELLRIVMFAYQDTAVCHVKVDTQVEEEALNGVGSRLEEEYQRAWLSDALYCGQESQDRHGTCAHLAKTAYERLWWMVAIVRIAVDWKLGEEDVVCGIPSDCSNARAVLEEAYEVVAMLRVMHIIPRDAASVDSTERL